ncbi:MAG: hypothetical protein Altm2KO_37260 [Alteromonas macleodii]
MSKVSVFCLSAALLGGAMQVNAKEGMFTPEQLPSIAGDLKETGLAIPASSINDLTAFPMGAIVSLGGCSASFVSEKAWPLLITTVRAALFNITAPQKTTI